jgi:hypothetical protein
VTTEAEAGMAALTWRKDHELRDAGGPGSSKKQEN